MATPSDIIEDYQLMYKDIFDCSGEDSSLYDSSNGGNQLLRSKFAKVRFACFVAGIILLFSGYSSQKFKAEFDKLFGGFTGTKLVTMNTRSFNGKIKGLLDKMKCFQLHSQSLKAYSQWLANYQPLQHGKRDLEVPGAAVSVFLPHKVRRHFACVCRTISRAIETALGLSRDHSRLQRQGVDDVVDP